MAHSPEAEAGGWARAFKGPRGLGQAPSQRSRSLILTFKSSLHPLGGQDASGFLFQHSQPPKSPSPPGREVGTGLAGAPRSHESPSEPGRGGGGALNCCCHSNRESWILRSEVTPLPHPAPHTRFCCTWPPSPGARMTEW